LNREQIREIVDLMLGAVNKQLQEKGINLEVTEAAKDFLGIKGYDEVFGARPLRRVIQNLLEDKLAEAVLHGEYRSGDTVIAEVVNDELVLHAAPVAALSGEVKV
jgi:ATP-dependent Clp protease ATP-binding subunit ClpC